MQYLEKIVYKALNTRVLAVAVYEKYSNTEFWAAYIGAVDGMNHDKEYKYVENCGSKLPEKVAKAIFPQYENVEYRW